MEGGDSNVHHDLSTFTSRFPDPVRILLVQSLDIPTTESAINEGEIFRFLLMPSQSGAATSGEATKTLSLGVTTVISMPFKEI